jgi:hypothetical protein
VGCAINDLKIQGEELSACEAGLGRGLHWSGLFQQRADHCCHTVDLTPTIFLNSQPIFVVLKCNLLVERGDFSFVENFAFGK